MRFPAKLLTVACGAVLVAGALAVAHGSNPAPAQAAQPSGEDAAPAAEVKGVAKALGISQRQARERLLDQAEAHQTHKRLPKSLQRKLAGHWFDATTGKLTVAVTSEADAAKARAAGAEAKVVDRSKAELDALAKKVRALAGGHVEGLSYFGVDPKRNDVLITVNSAANAETRAFLTKARELDGVRVTASGGAPVQQSGEANPGDPWWPGGESNCSIGFGATDSSGGKHFVTAGHCTNDANQAAYGQSGQQNKLGTSNVGGTRSVNAREGDMGVVAVTEPGWTVSPSVNTWGQPALTVTGSAEAMVDEAVCHSGNTAPNFECGKVTKVDQEIDYGHIVEGLTITTACSQGGDSGGAWLRGDKAVGLHSGAVNGNSCPAGDNAIFQPVNESLTKWGLTLVTGGVDDTEAPSVPGNPRSTGVTATTVSLAWDASVDNVGVAGYDVYNGSSLAKSVTGTTATVDGLAADTDYTFTIKARDAAGNVSAASAAVVARTKPGDAGDDEPPTTPGNPHSTGVTATTVSLAWDASVDNVGVAGYDVLRGTAVAATSTSTSATVTGLTANTEYSFTVQARDAAGNKSKPTRAFTVKTSGDGEGTRTFSNETDYPIRDFQVTTSQIRSNATGAAANPVTVKITASHTCQQDLQIGVVGPSGRYYQLQRYGGDGWNCTPFPSTRSFIFAPTYERAAAGNWTLRIGDNGPGDTGLLSGWSVSV